jgi:hypothetical protein
LCKTRYDFELTDVGLHIPINFQLVKSVIYKRLDLNFRKGNPYIWIYSPFFSRMKVDICNVTELIDIVNISRDHKFLERTKTCVIVSEIEG